MTEYAETCEFNRIERNEGTIGVICCGATYQHVREALPQAEVYVEAGEDDGQVRGFVGLTGDFIAGLFVRASAQSQGIGRALLQRAKAGRSFLRLGVYKKNPRAIAFYQREGFVIESEGLDENTDEPEFTMAWRKPPAAEQAVP